MKDKKPVVKERRTGKFTVKEIRLLLTLLKMYKATVKAVEGIMNTDIEEKLKRLSW